MSADLEIGVRRRMRMACAEAFGVEEHRLVGHSRKRDIVVPRQLTCYVLRRKFPEMSYPEIGRFMGGRDHSTILHSIDAAERIMAGDPALAAIVAGLLKGAEQLDLHVRAWRNERAARTLAITAPVRRLRPPARPFPQAQAADVRTRVASALMASPSHPDRDKVVAIGVAAVEEGRKVHPKNALADDDIDALRRKASSDALGKAIAAAGGWR